MDDLQETLDVEFPTEEFDSLGGFVFSLFGKIPVIFEKTSWKNLDFIIQEMDGHRIEIIKIIKRDSDSDDISE